MIRRATINDIKVIQTLINQFSKRDLMLPRSLNQLYETVRDFWVFVNKGKIVGCAAVHVCWDDLAEIKSLAVKTQYQSKGIGKKLINTCIEDAKNLNVKKLFVLTYKPNYFRKFGFRRIKNELLPHKIWAECINCAKFPDCKEVAMVKVL